MLTRKEVGVDDARRIWLDGAIMPRTELRLDPDDLGLAFGLGLFETTRTDDFLPRLWNRHLDRLLTAVARLESMAGSGGQLFGDVQPRLPDQAQVAAFVRATVGADAVVRLNLAATQIGSAPRLWMSTRPIPPQPMRGATLLVTTITPAPPSALGGLKSFHYGAMWLAARRAKFAGADDALLIADDPPRVLETSRAALLLEAAEGNLVSPDEPEILPSTALAALFEGEAPSLLVHGISPERGPAAPLSEIGVRTHLPGELVTLSWSRRSIERRRVLPDELRTAPALWMINSVRGLTPVARLMDPALNLERRFDLPAR
jgi:branched-subunit amino acid aminotransferase/4-amino-4-deoxychorismate lyase